ncbi:MAG: sulfatase [Planctomycetes bacterium]|nr:sulfatase [Planctomycetota bacterium]
MKGSRLTGRRDFLGRAGMVSVGLLLAGYERTAESPSSAAQAGGKRPNILFVFADQLRYSALGSSGNKVVRTPNFDRLASEGLVFDNALANHPLCSPYRANLLTGKYGFANGVPDNEYVLWDNQVTLAQALKAAGYHTGYVGKWHLGTGPYTPQMRYGFDYLFASNCPNKHYGAAYFRNEAGPITIKKFCPEGETDEAVQFLENHVKTQGGSPFALVMSWEPPHWPYEQYPRQFDTYDPAQVDLPPNVPVQMAEFARREIAQYYGNVSALDAQMGRLLEALSRLGIAEDTIVCFSSDHGDHLSSHGYGKPADKWMHPTMRASKSTPYEESVHIPFLLRYPRLVQGGRRTRALFGSVDVMPTLLDLCGVAIPTGVQGHSLAEVVAGKEGGALPDSVYLMNMGTGWPDRPRWVGLWRGVRTERWVYARWWHNQDEHEPLLFDRQNDPYEMNNLAGNPKFTDVQQQMETRLKKWMADTGDPFETGPREPTKGMLDLGFKLQPRWSRRPPG